MHVRKIFFVLFHKSLLKAKTLINSDNNQLFLMQNILITDNFAGKSL